VLLDSHQAGGYSELLHVHGAGSTGRRAGTRAWPGDAVMYVSIVPAERVEELTAALKDETSVLPGGERLHAAVLPIETFL
jgi:hypothetical protein